MNINEKFEKLKAYIKSLGSTAVAFSGGVDSAFLLKTAKDVLGDKAIAITAKPYSFPNRELDEAKAFCEKEGIMHLIADFNELEIEGFSKNPINRCYLCKKELFKEIIKIAKENNIENVAEGSNTDDKGDYRPGLQAIKELDIKSPLQYAGLNKEEIRILSHKLGLNIWDKPSFACLSSRFVYGEEITKDKLTMVDRAEQLLLNLGFRQVRVRIHGKAARIEVLPNEFNKLIEETNRAKIIDEFADYGFTYVSMDLKGYRTGSMNEAIKEK